MLKTQSLFDSLRKRDAGSRRDLMTTRGGGIKRRLGEEEQLKRKSWGNGCCNEVDTGAVGEEGYLNWFNALLLCSL